MVDERVMKLIISKVVKIVTWFVLEVVWKLEEKKIFSFAWRLEFNWENWVSEKIEMFLYTQHQHKTTQNLLSSGQAGKPHEPVELSFFIFNDAFGGFIEFNFW